MLASKENSPPHKMDRPRGHPPDCSEWAPSCNIPMTIHGWTLQIITDEIVDRDVVIGHIQSMNLKTLKWT